MRLQRTFAARPAGFSPGDLIARIEEAFSASPQPHLSPEPNPETEPAIVDPLAAVFVALVGLIGLLTGLYAVGYLRHDVAIGEIDQARA